MPLNLSRRKQHPSRCLKTAINKQTKTNFIHHRLSNQHLFTSWHLLTLYSPSIHSFLWQQTHVTVDETSELRETCFSCRLVTAAARGELQTLNLTPLLPLSHSLSLFFRLVTPTTENKKFSSSLSILFPLSHHYIDGRIKEREGNSLPPIRWLLPYLQGCQTVPFHKKSEVLV